MASNNTNPNLDNGLEHRVGTELHAWEYNNTVDENDFVKNIFTYINSLYTTSVANQKADCDIKRVGGKMSDFKRDLNANNYYGLSFNAYVLKYPLKNVFFFNNLFIHRLNRNSKRGRKYFQNSEVSNSFTFTLDDTPNRPDVFKHRLLMFIDGKLFTDLVLYTNTEYVLMVIDPDRTGITMKQIMDYCNPENDYRWTLIGIPFTTTKKLYDLRSTNLSGTKLNVSKYKDVNSRIINKNFWLCGMATAITNATDSDGNDYTDNRSIMNFTFVENIPDTHIIDIGTIGTKTMEDINKHTYISSEIINIPNVIAMLDIGKSRIFQFGCNEKYPSPIPPENMIVFSYDTENGYRLVHMCNEAIPKKGTIIKGDIDDDRYVTTDDLELLRKKLAGETDPRYKNNSNADMDDDGQITEADLVLIQEKIELNKEKSIAHYFPNVYKLNGFDPNTDLRILIMYGSNDKTTFKNPIETYMKYNTNYANEVVANVLPEPIKKYVPMENVYKEVNYLDYHYEATRNTEYEYKFDTLKELIHDDPSRLTDMYIRYMTKKNNEFYSSPRYVFDMSVDADKFEIYSNESGEFMKLSINVPDGRRFPATVWIDGIRESTVDISHDHFKTTISFSRNRVSATSIIIVELYKVRYEESVYFETQMPPIHSSMLFPRDYLYDVSPQSLMISVRKDMPTADGGYEYKYELASNYEMYWLIIGHNQYVNGIRTDYVSSIDAIRNTSVIMDNDGNVFLERGANYDASNPVEVDETQENVALIGSHSTTYNGDVSFLKELGNEDYAYVQEKESGINDNTDPVAMQNVGYYGGDRRRFYYYMPYGKKDPNIYITPITDYFANETVKIQNTDVYFTRTFVTSLNLTTGNQEFVFDTFFLDPNHDKYRLYVDGRLLDWGADFITDAYPDRGWYVGSDIKFVLLNIKTVSTVVFEYIPYRYRLMYRNVEHDGIITLRDTFTRPFNTAFYDVYLDGRLLNDKDIEVVSRTRFIIKELANSKEDTEHVLSIYEKGHDPDIFDYVWRDDNDEYNYSVKGINGIRHKSKIMSDVVDDMINTDRDFKKHMLPTWDEAKANKEISLGFGVGSIPVEE